MEVAPGYKQTDVGVIPEDWDDPELADIAKDDSPIRYGIVQVGQHVANGIPVLAIKNLNSDYVTNVHRASVETERAYARSRIHPDDVLVSVKGTIGRVGIVPSGFQGNISRDLARLRLREGLAPQFVFQMLQSGLAQQRMAAASVGTTRMELSIAILKKVRIPLPPTKAEQETIAEALSDADTLIESVGQLLAKKRDLKQGTMQELLTAKKRLPGFSGNWIVKRLGEVANIKTGNRNNQDQVEDGDYPFFVRSPTVERINSYSYDCEAILVPGEGNIGNIFHYITGRFDVHQRVYAITRFSREASGKFVFYYMVENFGAHAMQNSVKATVDSLRLPTFQNFEITIPPTTIEQSSIADILSDMDAEIAALEEKLGKARTIKRGMMQELLTGRIRLV